MMTLRKERTNPFLKKERTTRRMHQRMCKPKESVSKEVELGMHQRKCKQRKWNWVDLCKRKAALPMNRVNAVVEYGVMFLK